MPAGSHQGLILLPLLALVNLVSLPNVAAVDPFQRVPPGSLVDAANADTVDDTEYTQEATEEAAEAPAPKAAVAEAARPAVGGHSAVSVEATGQAVLSPEGPGPGSRSSLVRRDPGVDMLESVAEVADAAPVASRSYPVSSSGSYGSNPSYAPAPAYAQPVVAAPAPVAVAPVPAAPASGYGGRSSVYGGRAAQPVAASAPGAACLVPMWGASDYVCKEHLQATRDMVYIDSLNVERKLLPDKSACTVACPAKVSYFQTPDVTSMNCRQGMWSSDTGLPIEGIACSTSKSFSFGCFIMVAGTVAAVLYFLKVQREEAEKKKKAAAAAGGTGAATEGGQGAGEGAGLGAQGDEQGHF